VVNLPVLVLNQNYEPLNICHVRRALILLFRGKAEVMENGRGYLHSIDGTFDIPSVIRLMSYIRRPNRLRRMTKIEVFNRDKFTCQYCGMRTRELTIDHVMPRKRGGKHTWENVVSACVPCNRRKAGRTPKEANMPLLSEPKPPVNHGFYIPYTYLTANNTWRKYMRN
jgi:5-methylcytosine-specific restriction endonuclease McrA